MTTDDRLRRALRSLPAPATRPDFTGRVLARLDATGAAMGSPAPRWAAAAAAALLVAGLGAWSLDRGTRQARRAEVLALRDDAARLEQEIEALARESERSAPVLYLGGTEEVDLVLDLSRFAALPASDS